MPLAAPHPCYRCRRALVAHGTRHCAPCAEIESRERPNSTERGYDRAWRHAALEYLEVNRYCANVMHDAPVRATDVDHVIRWQSGRTPEERERLKWNRSNWQPLCSLCHKRKSGRERAALRSVA